MYPELKKSRFGKGWLRTTDLEGSGDMWSMQFLAVTFDRLRLSFPIKLSENPTGSTLKICHRCILFPPSPRLPPWSLLSCLPGVLLLPSSLQSSLYAKVSLVLLKNKPDCVTPLHKIHQTLPCSCRITPKAVFYSRRNNPVCLHLLSFSELDSDMFPLTHSSSPTSCYSLYIPHKCHRAFAHHFLCF